jgi:hypothetical protein
MKKLREKVEAERKEMATQIADQGETEILASSSRGDFFCAHG